MPTTVQATLDQAYRYLTGMANEQRNVLDGTVGTGATTYRFTYALAGITPGVTLSVDLELLYVVDANPASKSVTVIPAQYGSTAAAHNDGATVFVAPKFPYFNMLAELNNDLSSLSAPINGLYQIKTVDITATSNVIGYDLGDPNAIELIDVRSDQFGPAKDWARLIAIELVPYGDIADFPSGMALEVADLSIIAGQTMHVRYKAAFTPVVGLNDTLEVTAGLPATAVDIPPLGIAAQLMAVRENKRTFTEAQSDTRRANEVPPGATSNAARQLMAMRMARINEESSRLDRHFPIYRR